MSEHLTVHIIWMTSGLGCDGDTVAMTAATNPSLEDLLHRTLPGTPGVALYNPFLAVESGEDFMQAWYDAEAGKLDPFILVLEGAARRRRPAWSRSARARRTAGSRR
jgi:hydrogenase small subunit